MLNWLTRIFNQGTLKISSNDNHIATIIADFKVKLGYYLIETYANTIIEQFFNIIVGKSVIWCPDDNTHPTLWHIWVTEFPHQFRLSRKSASYRRSETLFGKIRPTSATSKITKIIVRNETSSSGCQYNRHTKWIHCSDQSHSASG